MNGLYNKTLSDQEYEKLRLNEDINSLNTNNLSLKTDINAIEYDKQRLAAQKDIEKSKYEIESKHMRDYLVYESPYR